VFVSLALYGHVYPLMPLALECAAAGHDVTIATGEPFLGRLPLPTVRGVPEGLDVPTMMAETARRHPELRDLLPPDHLDLPVAMFADTMAGHVIPVLLPQLAALQPDLVVYEATAIGAGVAADVLGIPALAHGITLWGPFFPSLHRAAADYQREHWIRGGGVPPTDGRLLADGYLDPAPPTLQHCLGEASPDRQAIRPVPWSESIGELPAGLGGTRTRPRVYVTLGTVFGAVDVLRRLVLEIAALDADVLVALGPDADAATLGAVPGNVHVERFVPQAAVLPHVDVVVHHGGFGTMLGALTWGVPQLVLPQGADQFINATVLAAAGAGRGLDSADQAPGVIEAAVAELLAPGPARAAAQRLREELAGMPSPAQIVPVLEQAAKAQAAA
jgi:hypothetical protein